MGEPTALSLRDLNELYPRVKLAHGDKWGNWTYDAETLVLCYSSPRYSCYEVDLEECTTSKRVLDWINHVCWKGWMSAQDKEDMIRAFQDILDLDDLIRGPIKNIKKHLNERTYTREKEVKEDG